ncbi:helix-turn-helix domain-containing protein [Paenibacillus sp. OAS669]|uniref:helix-turn-helix domain-containing protein n=1 Tax=Paenibacillus sp. OAS669 TaxID=2663821 RepID=UPI00178A05E7|nr:helix-turn-helix domain-containing protein [Paenibacillus sp. OAS669]MBE1442026.1 AraC-like DNA-binding protein [Paenibacillus sp. OAS669]
MWRFKGREAGSHQVFIRLLVPNLLFLLLPLLVGGIIYYKTLHEMEKEVTAGNMNVLQQSRDILDRRLAELSSIAIQLVNDTRIMQFQHIREPFQGSNINRIWDTRKAIQNFSLTNNFIFHYFVIYKNSELVFTENSTYGLFDFYNTFRYVGLDADSWKDMIIGSYQQRSMLPSHQVIVNGNMYTLLTYIHSLGYPGYPQGAVVITIDNREVQKLMGGLDLSGGGWAYIIDQNGKMISTSASDAPVSWIQRSKLAGKEGSMLEQIDNQPMRITYTTSSYNGWTYLVAQPDHIVLKKVLYIKKIIFAMTLIFLASGLLIAYLIAYRNSRPLRTIMETIMERMEGRPETGPDAYRFIRESVSRLIDNNHELTDKMKKHAPYLQAALFERLLKGDFLSAKDTSVLLQHVGIEAQGSHYSVVIVQLQGYDGGFDASSLEELDLKRVMIKEMLRGGLKVSMYWHDLAEDQIALLIAYGRDIPDPNLTYLAEALPGVGEMILAQLNVRTRFAIGGIYKELLHISRSFEEAKQALQFLSWRNQNGAARYDEIPQEHSGYYYPSDLEIRLSNLALAGEYAAVESVLTDLHRINFVERRLSVPMLQLFMNEMIGTLIKLLPQMGLNEGILQDKLKLVTTELTSYEGLEKQYLSYTAVYRQLCNYVNDHKKSQNGQLLDSIIALLQETFTDPDISLDSVAERMGISRGYLSQFFKEQTGINFSDYLEGLRMKLARELLAETDLHVFEIAVRVGYSSSNTFCRAFKRINGVSTTAFRSSKVI